MATDNVLHVFPQSSTDKDAKLAPLVVSPRRFRRSRRPLRHRGWTVWSSGVPGLAHLLSQPLDVVLQYVVEHIGDAFGGPVALSGQRGGKLAQSRIAAPTRLKLVRTSVQVIWASASRRSTDPAVDLRLAPSTEVPFGRPIVPTHQHSPKW